MLCVVINNSINTYSSLWYIEKSLLTIGDNNDFIFSV